MLDDIFEILVIYLFADFFTLRGFIRFCSLVSVGVAFIYGFSEGKTMPWIWLICSLSVFVATFAGADKRRREREGIIKSLELEK